MGLLIMMQFRSYVGVETLLSREASEQDVVSTVYALKMANESLKEDISSLEDELQKYLDLSKSNENITAEIEKNKLLLSLKPIFGPGLQVEITSDMKIEDFVDFTNEWWAAGAEAIILNGYSIIENHNSFYDLNELHLLNGEILESPYIFQIIGDPDVLENFLLKSSFLEKATYTKLREITA